MRGTTFQRVLPLCLLFLLFALLTSGMGMKSPTADEQNHVARGLAYLKTGDLRLSQEHPPGVNAWEAWPLLFDPRIRLPLDSSSWADAEWYGFADQLMWGINDRPQAMIFATRVPVVWLTLVLAALVYRWARDLGGRWAGVISLVLLSLDPNILAHGRLTTTDVGLTCTAVAAMFALWRAVARPTWRRWLLAGLALGAAQLAKFSALVLGPLALLIVALAWGGDRKAHGPRRWIGRLLALFGIGFAVVWAGYAFTWGPSPLWSRFPVPAPAYWSGIGAILHRTGGGNPAFLMGQYSREGWWNYFPVAFAIKTPLPTLALLLAAPGMWAARRIAGPPARPEVRRLPRLLCLVLPPLAFWAMAVSGSFNIGYRHILPSLPFLYILAGSQIGHVVEPGPSSRRRARLAIPVVCALLLWLAVGTFSIAPHYLAFFNAIAGGPDGGYRFLVDSNLDWGQDLPGLAGYVRARGIDRIYLSWFGAAHPEAYGLPFHPLPGFWRFGGEPAAYGFNPYAPAPGTYAISASNLQGLTFADHDLYAWFRARTPIARVGHSVMIYRVEDRPASREAVALGVPMAQLAEEERSLLRRGASVRRYDPSTGVIVPSGSTIDQEAWFVAPVEPEWGRRVRTGPGYVVVKGSIDRAPVSALGPRFAGLVAAVDHSAPGPSLARDETFQVTVRWRVEDEPHRAAVSFAHLLDDRGQFLAGWDGLTAPATCWQQGDLIVQRYDIPLPPGLLPGTYPIEVGWYDAGSGERWPAVTADGEPIGDRWLLPGVEVRP